MKFTKTEKEKGKFPHSSVWHVDENIFLCGHKYIQALKYICVHFNIPVLLLLVTERLFCFWDKILFFLIDEVNVNEPQHGVSADSKRTPAAGDGMSPAAGR